MYQIEWGSEPLGFDQEEIHYNTKVDVDYIESVYLLHWAEHCVECAIPQCYGSCSLFIHRKDQKCARFVNGIFANHYYNGLYNFGADIVFRRWGKIESYLQYGVLPISYHHRLADILILTIITIMNGGSQESSLTSLLKRKYLQ
jgi:hypothetical protein